MPIKSKRSGSAQAGKRQKDDAPRYERDGRSEGAAWPSGESASGVSTSRQRHRDLVYGTQNGGDPAQGRGMGNKKTVWVRADFALEK